jgi:regulatory protein
MDIRDIAAKYLASRARSTGEMKAHLKSKGYDESEISAVIYDFLEYGYLNDEDYCRQYIKYAFSKGKGPIRVKQELAEKGIDRDTIAFALEDCEMEESDLERALVQARKTVAGKTVDEKMKGRIGRRLVSLGYSTDIAYKVIGILMRNDNE